MVQLIKTITKAMLTPMNILSAVLHHVHAFLSTLLLYILSLGPIPRHVGFVMDGNRRYARGRGMKAVQGHHDGMNSLRRVSPQPCTWTTKLISPDPRNLPEVTNTSGHGICILDRQLLEIERRGGGVDEAGGDGADGVMSKGVGRMCATVLDLWLIVDRDLLQEYGVRIRFVGSRHLLPQELQDAIVRMEKMTRRNKGYAQAECRHPRADTIEEAS